MLYYALRNLCRWMAKICNVLLPFSIYYTGDELGRETAAGLSGYCFRFLFFGAFQIVLLYLFGQSIIAVDMFLNLVTTNSSEALGIAGQSDTCYCYCSSAIYSGIDSGDGICHTQNGNCPELFIQQRAQARPV